MSGIPRRTLDELRLLYELNSDRQDIYVEGPFDQAIIAWFVGKWGVANVAIYSISAIDIPETLLIQSGLKTNNRSRVIELSNHISKMNAAKAACIIDADFSIFMRDDFPSYPLLQTDYCCMEMYAFNSDCISKFISIFCQRHDWPISTIQQQLAGILEKLFLIRCVNDSLGWGMDWLDKIVCATIDEWDISIDFEGYVKRFLNKNSRMSDEKEFLESLGFHKSKLLEDSRYQMHGHDFIELFYWYLKKKKAITSQYSLDSISSGMMACLDFNVVNEEPMFRKLREYIS